MAEKFAKRILVIGGGVGGMSVAMQLGKMGVSVDLIDIDPHWRAAGAGLTLNGATLRSFGQLGVLDKIAEAGDIHGGRQVMGRHDNTLVYIPAYKPAPDDLSAGGGILRPVLHGILSSETKKAGVNVRLGLSVETLIQHEDHVDIKFFDGSSGQYDVVVGADGISSQTRRTIFPDAPKPAFTGQGCWRAVFPRADEVTTTRIYVDHSYKMGFNPVSDKEMYMFLLETAEGNPWRDEADWIDLLRERMKIFAGLPARLADELSESSLVNYRPLESLLLPLPWHVGRVVLLGDAVHATTPHAGYGAGLSIEDGIVLAEYLGKTEDPETAFTRYEERRFERCRTVLEGSVNIGRLEMAGAGLTEQIGATMSLVEATYAPF